MRIEVDFERALDADQRMSCSLAVATLAKGERFRFSKGDSGLIIYGEAMSAARVREAMQKFELPVSEVRSSLPSEEDQAADDLDEGTNKERIKAIGR